jgi:hypothetical protein
MGRPKTDRTNALRVERYRLARAGEGWRTRGFLLPADVLAGIDALCKASGESGVQLICRLVRRALDDDAGDVL